ncbi:hypothetical protein RLW55_05910 [Hyphomicrobium sp. B1]|uniref:hypothetical protein n=1 Tax=Hyphomicrobium sp. B1 TaxID=3075651 RepID=UPI003C2D6357
MTQPTGNFIAYLNRDKEPGDKKPAFDGRIGIPGRDEELRFAIWAHEYKTPSTGEVQIMFNGQAGNVATSAAPLDQVATLLKASPEGAEATIGNLTLAPRQVVLFPNRFKAEAPEKDRPDYWGAFNPGNGDPVVRISAWTKKDRNGHAMLAGATSYPLPGKSEPQQQDATIDSLVAAGAVSKGMPKTKAKAVTGRA